MYAWGLLSWLLVIRCRFGGDWSGRPYFHERDERIMQLSTEPNMRGRVMATRVAVALGGTSIGAPIVGRVANHFGPRWSLGSGALAAFLAALVAALMIRKPVARQ